MSSAAAARGPVCPDVPTPNCGVSARSFVHPSGEYLQFTVYSLQFTVYSLQFTVYSLQFTVYSLQFTVYSLQFITGPPLLLSVICYFFAVKAPNCVSCYFKRSDEEPLLAFYAHIHTFHKFSSLIGRVDLNV